MGNGIALKVCGVTTPEAAAAAADSGADYLGFNFYPKSPRYLTPERYAALASQLPGIPRVAVVVEPTTEDLARLGGGGFQAYQIHFRPEVGPGALAAWTAAVGGHRLWLAPKLLPGAIVPPEILELADTYLLDTYSPDRFGGTGRTGDWGAFARHRVGHPGKTWILAGGLNAGNIAEAVRGSGARFVDVNSGVESSPGVKDPALIRAFAAALNRAAPSPG